MALNLIGQRFGMLQVTGHARIKGVKGWAVVCDCGGASEVTTGALRSGNTKSCGCQKANGVKAANARRALTGEHPFKTHGYCNHPLYTIWRMMVRRCTDANYWKYKDYGGRGITVCPEWLDFLKFVEDMGERPEGHSIERRENDLGYCKTNCYWATAKEQARNRRSTVMLTWEGKTQSMVAWAEELGLSYGAMKQRYAAGKPVETILKKQGRYEIFNL